MKTSITICMLYFLAACGGEQGDAITGSVVQGQITDFSLLECLCCPSVTIETDSQTYLVDEFPSTSLHVDELPTSVLIQLTPYEGECPNRSVSVSYLDR